MKTALGVRGFRRVTDAYLRRAKWRDLRLLLTTSTPGTIIGASINPFKERLKERELRRVLNSGTRVILLIRENLLKQHISHLNVLAEKKSGARFPYKSYSHDGRVTDRKFHIGPEAVAEIEKLRDQRDKLLEMVNAIDVPRLELTYERHINVANKKPLLQKLAEFIDVEIPDAWRTDVPPSKNAPRYHKLVSDDLREVIENYSEIEGNAAMAEFL